MKRLFQSKFFSFLLVFGLCLSVFFGWVSWSNRNFVETFYSLYSSKVDTRVRAILLSDLHQASFGENNDRLISRVGKLEPDVILIAGDVVTKGKADIDYAVSLCGQLARIAPVYFGLGNHENSVIYGGDLNKDFLEENRQALGDDPECFDPLIQDSLLLDGLKSAGVTVLQNGSAAVEVGENRLEIGGISTNISSFWPYSGQFVSGFAGDEPGNFKILISHRPDPIMRYIAGYPIDLVVSGHGHGGVIRIPGKGGLLDSEGGFFPEYDGGRFERGDMTLIVSRGLGGHGWIPRIFNPPELVVIDIL